MKPRAPRVVATIDMARLTALVVLAACSTQPTVAKRDVAVPPITAAAPFTLTASDGTGLLLRRVDAKAVFVGPLAFTELHLYFHNAEPRTREGTFAITLPARAAVARFAMQTDGRWMEAEVVDKSLARRAYDDAVHRGVDPALLEKGAGNQFTARVFPIPANADKHLVVSYTQIVAADHYVLPLRGLPPVEQIDVELASTDATGATRFERMTKRGWRADRDFVSRSPATGAAVVAGSLAVIPVQIGNRSAPRQTPRGVTLLVDTSASRAADYSAYVGSVERLVEELRKQWGAALPIQIVAFDQTVEEVRDPKALRERGAAGASDLGGALAWLEAHRPQPRVLLVTDGVVTAGVEGAVLANRVAALSIRGVQRLDVVLAGTNRDDASARLFSNAGLPWPGVVFELGVDPIAVAMGDPVSTTVSIDIANSSWSHPRRLGAMRAGTTAIVYARLDEPATTLDITVDDKRTQVRPLPVALPWIERTVAAAEIEELEAEMLRAPDARKAELATVIAKKSVATRVLSSQTSMLVLEFEADYARYQIPRHQLSCALVVGKSGVECPGRAFVPPPPPPPPSPHKKVIKVTGTEISIDGKLVATTESVLRDDSPTFQIDALREQLQADLATDVAIEVDGSADPRLLQKIENTTTNALVDQSVGLNAAHSDADRRIAQAQLDRLRAQQADLQRRLADHRAGVRTSGLRVERPIAVRAVGTDLGTIQQAIAAGEKPRAIKLAREWHGREPTNILAIIALGEALEASGEDGAAARMYGSIIDLYPARAELRRFAGERLERVADRHPEVARALAIDTYRRALADRPEHLTGHRLLAYALLRDGQHAQAFETIIGALDRQYREDSYRGAMRVLEEDAALIGRAYALRSPEQRTAIANKLAAHSLLIATAPSTRFILYWETDANDVDFHVEDKTGEHAFYQHMTLRSGGELYADVTTGFGPECFTIPGTPSAGPYKLGVHYFSRGAMGFGMGMVEIERFDGKQLSFEHRPYVIENDRASLDLGTFTR